MTTSVYAISCGGDKNVLELVFFFLELVLTVAQL